MAASSSTAATIKFAVQRRPAVLVAPASPTPREVKLLSDVDDQGGLRRHVSFLHFYERNKETASMAMGGKDKDPAVVIRDAIARALVPYYPFAGRLREHDGGKLAVDCTAEGVLFVEADADVRLEQFGDSLLPPFPCVEELILDVPGSSAIVDAPILLIQVTRLACGGFVMAVRQNHVMADAQGLTQFLGAVAELARGDTTTTTTTTVQPVWERHLLQGRRRKRNSQDDKVTDDGSSSSSSSIMPLPHDHDDKMTGDSSNITMLPLLPLDNMALRSFFFGPGEIAAIRAQLSSSSSSSDLEKHASRFDVIAGWLWKYRTMALAPDSNQPMLMSFVVNARGRTSIIPTGYYGNTFALPFAVSTAGELCANPVSYAVRLVKETKAKVDMEYMRSEADLIVLRRGQVRRRFPAGFYSLSDLTRARFNDLDFGWGKPVYGGPAEVARFGAMASFIIPFKNGAVVPVCLPAPAMDRLVDEMGKLQRSPPANVSF